MENQRLDLTNSIPRVGNLIKFFEIEFFVKHKLPQWNINYCILCMQIINNFGIKKLDLYELYCNWKKHEFFEFLIDFGGTQLLHNGPDHSGKRWLFKFSESEYFRYLIFIMHDPGIAGWSQASLRFWNNLKPALGRFAWQAAHTGAPI